jgi:DNA replication licensing factor MCM6
MVTPDTTTPGQQSNQQLNGQSHNILASLNQNNEPEVNEDKAQEALLQSFTPYEVQDLKNLVHSEYIYSRLVDSIAPMIYGHRQIKKGLLLQLIGGVSKHTEQENMQLRGDINICIVGDPSTSKSQFLKYAFKPANAISVPFWTPLTFFFPGTSVLCILALFILAARHHLRPV